MIGETILHYRVIQILGEGGMGIVYLADDMINNRQVTLKFMPPEIALDPDERLRFEHELNVLAALDDPNIARVYAIEETGEKPLIVTEFIQGMDMSEIIRSGNGQRIGIKEIIGYALQLGNGLYAAHKNSVIHGNIKSHNIIIDEEGNVKIIDFGLAALNRKSSSDLAKYLEGSLYYMSPEQLNEEPVDQRTDLWSYGVLLYELITGHLPFTGTYASAIIYSIMNDPVPPLSLQRNDLPPGIDILIIGLLQRERDRRITSFKLVLDLLKRMKTE